MRLFGRALLLLLIMFFVTAAQAQNRTIKGKVTDTEGEAVIGANVTVVGNNKTATITDMDGNFSISVPDKSVILKITYLGYKSMSFNMPKGKNTLSVTMEEEATMLDETVVTAMGLRRDERSLSSAFQKVDTEGMTETRDANFLNSLTGKVAGLQVISNGAAGSASVIIRGMNSITGNNQPLYVIDGVPIINDVETGEMNIDYGNPAASLNPDDIESMTVLKGANASALYGSDAANGVIMITTKKASQKKGLGISYSTNLQFSSILEYPSYQNKYGSGENGFEIPKKGFNYFSNNEFVYDPTLPYGIGRLSAVNQRSWGLPMFGFDVIGRNGLEKTYSAANSIIDLYSTSHMWTNTLSIEKASDVANVRLSYTNVTSDDVMMKQNELSRNILNLRAEIKPVKKLSIDVGVRYTNETVDNRNARNADKKNPLYAVAWMPRDISIGELTPWKNPDGTLIGFPGGFINPLWCLNEISNSDEKNWVLANAQMTYEIIKGLKVRVKGAIDYNQKSGYYFVNKYGGDEVMKNLGQYKEFSENYKNITYEGLLSYDKRWKDLNLSASVGASSQDYTFKKVNAQVNELLVPDWKSLANNASTPTAWQDYNSKKKQAVFGTASLGLFDAAYLDFTGRNDWSSALPSDNRSYFYTSIGASAILTELVKIPKSILSFAKLRASYAKVGNDTGFDKLIDGLSYAYNFKGDPWYASGNKKLNPNLKPESTTSFEIGADLRFLNNRISLDYTYYTKTTKDQILDAKITNISGYTEAVVNAGKVKNWGHEISLSATPVKTKHFSWETTLNWAQNKNEVLELSNGDDKIWLVEKREGFMYYCIEVGRPMGTLYATMAEMDDQGRLIVGANGLPVKSSEPLFLADVMPDWTGGWRNSFRYKNFSASILVDFRKGGKLWSAPIYQGTRDGQTIKSLEGRDESLFSNLILGENESERLGYLQTNHTVNPNSTNVTTATEGVYVPYGDGSRPKGLQPNAVYGDGTGLHAGMTLAEANSWLSANAYWCGNCDRNARDFLYDTSFIKIREISVGYDFPRSLLSKMGNVIRSMKISFVGRNLGYIHKKTPKGVDPEASSSLGVIQGFDNGFSLPTASYGFDFKVTF